MTITNRIVQKYIAKILFEVGGECEVDVIPTTEAMIFFLSLFFKRKVTKRIAIPKSLRVGIASSHTALIVVSFCD
jgi:hypothetical protein